MPEICTFVGINNQQKNRYGGNASRRGHEETLKLYKFRVVSLPALKLGKCFVKNRGRTCVAEGVQGEDIQAGWHDGKSTGLDRPDLGSPSKFHHLAKF